MAKLTTWIIMATVGTLLLVASHVLRKRVEQANGLLPLFYDMLALAMIWLGVAILFALVILVVTSIVVVTPYTVI